MSINLTARYPDKVGEANSDYPTGEPRNVTTTGAGDGTPWEALVIKEFIGFRDAALLRAGLTANNLPETANNSQILDGLRDYIVGEASKDSVFVQQSDGVDVCDIINKMGQVESCAVKYDTTASVLSISCLTSYIDSSNPRFVYVYNFKQDPDGIWDLDTLVVAESNGATITNQSVVVGDLVGTWNTSTGNYYTANVGDSFTMQGITGCTKVELAHREDGRGGLFKATVFNSNLDEVCSRLISTYNATADEVRSLICDGLESSETYSIYFEFIGDDKFNAPSEAARGWILGTDTLRLTNENDIYEPSASVTKTVMSDSVSVFAIRARPSGSSSDYTWTPVHSGLNNVSRSVSYKIFIESYGKLISGNADVSNISSEYIKADSVKIIQRYNAYNYYDDADPMWLGQVLHNISKDGWEVSHSVEFINDTDIQSAYLFMHAAKNDVFSKYISFGSDYSDVYSLSGSDVSRVYPAQKNSIFYSGELKAGRAIVYGGTVNNLYRSTNYGRYDPFDTQQSGLLTDRSLDQVTKSYHFALQDESIIEAGTKWSVDYKLTVGLAINPLVDLSVI